MFGKLSQIFQKMLTRDTIKFFILISILTEEIYIYIAIYTYYIYIYIHIYILELLASVSLVTITSFMLCDDKHSQTRAAKKMPWMAGFPPIFFTGWPCMECGDCKNKFSTSKL